MRTPSIIINAILFLVTTALVIRSYRVEGGKTFRYFTVLSNAFSGVTALVMLIGQLTGSGPFPAALLLKHMSTVCVTLTFLIVMLFLGPTQGWKFHLTGRNFFMHLVGPVLAFVSYCFMEKQPMPFAKALLGLLPVAVYGVVYLYKVVLAPEKERWEDFYGFNRGGKWPLVLAIMAAVTVGVCFLVWKV